MKLVVIGASGRLGGAIARESLRRGHHVTAAARDVANLDDLPGVAVAAADLRDPAGLPRVLAGHDAVIVAVRGRDDQEADTTPAAARALTSALPAAGVRRLVFVGGAGSLLAAPGVRFLDQPGFPAPLRAQSLAQVRALEILQSNGTAIDWSYLSPAVRLVDGERSGDYRTAAGDEPVRDANGDSRITTADLASAAVDAVEQGTFIRQRFTVGY